MAVKNKKPSSKTLKRKLWEIFSKYIRLRDQSTCISCDKRFDAISELDAGHYHPRTSGMALFFDERNVHAQCRGCNRFRHGNLAQYALALQRRYGKGILEELDKKRQEIKKYSTQEYIDLIEYYKLEIDKLEKK